MRLIDAEAFEADVRKRYCKDCNKGSIFCTVCETENMLSEIEEAPTIEAKPVVHAHWEVGGMHLSGVVGNWKCSACKRRSLENSDYCPNCGAQMDEVVK